MSGNVSNIFNVYVWWCNDTQHKASEINIFSIMLTIITALILIRLMCWRFASACEFNDEHTELKEQYVAM